MTDKRMKSSRKGFAEYVERTSGFVPWFPRSSRSSGSHRGQEPSPT
jgi:steroid 5-alpha reductase family enzyme